MTLSALTNLADFYSVHGSEAAMNDTDSANVLHSKSGMTKQPATLPSHFCCAKDERALRAREGSLDSLSLHHATPLGRLA